MATHPTPPTSELVRQAFWGNLYADLPEGLAPGDCWGDEDLHDALGAVLSALAAAGRLNDGQAEAHGYARAPVVPPVTPDPDLPATPDAALSADGRAALTQDLQRMARDRRLAADADLTRHREDGTQP